jgi:hypothetical protein
MPPRQGGRMPPAHDEGPRPGMAVDPPSQGMPPRPAEESNSVTMDSSVGRCTPFVVVRRQAPCVLLRQYGANARRPVGGTSSRTAPRAQ